MHAGRDTQRPPTVPRRQAEMRLQTTPFASRNGEDGIIISFSPASAPRGWHGFSMAVLLCQNNYDTADKIVT